MKTSQEINKSASEIKGNNPLNGTYIANLEDIVREEKSFVENIKGSAKVITIGIFDLTGSTPLKLEHGHHLGTRTALFHNHICRRIIEEFDGAVIKELGDGILSQFDDPLKACLAAVNMIVATKNFTDFSTKVALTIGEVEEIKVNDAQDVLGSAVDRCARLIGHADPDEIIIDKPLEEVVNSFIKDFDSLSIENPKVIELRGIGETEIFKLNINGYQFKLHSLGRRTINEKVQFFQSATSEVIELGIGLKTFSGYFFQRRSEEFKDHVIELLKKGVNFKCIMLNPDSQIASTYSADCGEPDYVNDMRRSLDKLKRIKKEFQGMNLSGRFDIYIYNKLPTFHAVCVDPSTPNGKFFISHYMYETERAETPGISFSKFSNPELFEKYYNSIQQLLSKCHLHEPSQEQVKSNKRGK